MKKYYKTCLFFDGSLFPYCLFLFVYCLLVYFFNIQTPLKRISKPFQAQDYNTYTPKAQTFDFYKIVRDYELRQYGDVQNRIITEFKLTPETVDNIKSFEEKWKLQKEQQKQLQKEVQKEKRKLQKKNSQKQQSQKDIIVEKSFIE